MDVVALNWSEKSALLGEARWTSRPLSTQSLDELRAKRAAVLPEAGWHIHYALFSRRGFREPLQQQAQVEPLLLVGLNELTA